MEKGMENSQVFRCGGDQEDIEIPQALLPVGFKTCLLAGEIDILKFKESLTCSTFVLQLHTDDLCERVFSASNVREYNKEKAGPTPDASPREEETTSPRGKGGKAGKAAPAEEASKSLVNPSSGPIERTDELILSWIDSALEDSSKIKSHGAMRFRLEKLLESATDKLLEFEKTRTGKDLADLNVVVTVR